MTFLHTTKEETSAMNHFCSSFDGAQGLEDLVELGAEFQS